MNAIKLIEAFKEESARLEGLREYAKEQAQLDLAMAIIDIEHRLLTVRQMAIDLHTEE